MSTDHNSKNNLDKSNNISSTPKVDTLYKKKDAPVQSSTIPPWTSEPQIHIREFSLEEQSKIEPLLQKKLHHSLISHRPGPGGSKAAYLEGNVVINLANSILGFNGWSFQIKELKIEHKERTNTGDFYVVSSCLVRIILKDGTFREDIGFGDIKNKLVGPAIENSKKGAITDGLKRALRLFGNSLGNCLYDKEFINKKPVKNEAESDRLIKKSDTYPELINSRVPTNIHNTPGITSIKPEMPGEYFDDVGNYLDTGNFKKRNVDQLYGNSDSTPVSATKKANTNSPNNSATIRKMTPNTNLNSAIKKEAEKDTDTFVTKIKHSAEDLAAVVAEEEKDDEIFTDDSLDIEDLDREIAESKIRRERMIIEEQKKLEEKEKGKFLDKIKPLEVLPSNLKEEKLLFKSAASLKNIMPKKENNNLVDDLNNIIKASDFSINNENAIISDKPLLLNTNKSMKISSDKFEKLNHFKDLKNRKYVASAHEKQNIKK